jgi:signal transduction histidine kinase
MKAHRLAQEFSDEANRELARELAADVDAAAAALRALVHGVMPAPLVERGLAAAVQELAHALPVRARLDVRDVPARLPEPVESTAYFVVAEALANVVKHAEAERVDVRLRVADEVLRIDIEDDGQGGARVDGEGSGLSGLRDRLNVLGGTLAVTSGGSGTRLSAMVPCA